VKPATIAGWEHCLSKWLLPFIGDMLLKDVTNKTARELVEKMSEGGLGPKTIVNNVQVLKLVIASAVNENGEQLYPRAWNHEFMQLPIVEKDKQERQTISEQELNAIIAGVDRKFAVMFALMAGTGLRIGEILGVRGSDFSEDRRVLHVRRSIWNGQEQLPKTSNAVRVVDLHETLARILHSYITGDGYLFATRDGKPLNQRNALKVLHGVKKVGFHSFRRFRIAVLRKSRVPEDLIQMWVGHSQTLTDLYALQLREDELYRGEWCERAGLGFSVGQVGQMNVVEMKIARSA
jgi:integrase